MFTFFLYETIISISVSLFIIMILVSSEYPYCDVDPLGFWLNVYNFSPNSECVCNLKIIQDNQIVITSLTNQSDFLNNN